MMKLTTLTRNSNNDVIDPQEHFRNGPLSAYHDVDKYEHQTMHAQLEEVSGRKKERRVLGKKMSAPSPLIALWSVPFGLNLFPL